MAQLLHFLLLCCALLSTAAGNLESPCTLCPIEGDSITKPDQFVQITEYPLLDCATLEGITPSFFITEVDCNIVQSISPLCGCRTTQSDPCILCSNGTSISNPDTIVPGFASSVLNIEDQTCEIVEVFLLSQSAEDEVCVFGKHTASSVCDCPIVIPTNVTVDGDITLDKYDTNSTSSGPFKSHPLFGAESESAAKVLSNLYRASSILSMVGATLVLVDTIRVGRRKQEGQRSSPYVYNQIIFTMSFYDILAAFIYALGDVVVSTDTSIFHNGAAGNDATCTAAGFFKLLGMLTSVFLNGTLSSYYLLVIVKSAHERRLCELRKWLIGIPILCGFILACASIPFIVPTLSGCGLTFPSELFSDEALKNEGYPTTWGPYLALFMIPALMTITYATGAVVRIYLHVNKTRNGSSRFRQTDSMLGSSRPSYSSRRRRRGQNRRTSLLTREVSWQCGFYLAALYASWIVLLSVAMVASRGTHIFEHYNMWCTFHFLVPLQPFLNCIVYFRPRLTRKFRELRGKYYRWREDHERLRKQLRQENERLPPSSSSSEAPIVRIDVGTSGGNREGEEKEEEQELDNDYWPENSLAEMNSRMQNSEECTSSGDKRSKSRSITSSGVDDGSVRFVSTGTSKASAANVESELSAIEDVED